jgi:hypothetical protein
MRGGLYAYVRVGLRRPANALRASYSASACVRYGRHRSCRFRSLGFTSGRCRRSPWRSRRGLVVEVLARSSAAFESAAAVLVRPADPLHHSVDGDERGVVSFMVAVPFSLVWSSFGRTGQHRSHRSWHGPCCRFTLCPFRTRAARRRCRTRLPTPSVLPRLACCWGRCCGRFRRPLATPSALALARRSGLPPGFLSGGAGVGARRQRQARAYENKHGVDPRSPGDLLLDP